MIFRALILIGVLQLPLFSQSSSSPWVFPKSEVGQAARSFVEFFNAHDLERASVWELNYRSDEAAASRSLDDRLANYRTLWSQLGALDVQGFLEETEAAWSVWGYCTGWNRWIAIRFLTPADSPGKFEGVLFEPIENPVVARASYPDGSLSDLLEALRKDADIPGLALAVVDHGRVETVVAGRRFDGGPLLESTDRFHVGSTGKAMTATLLGLMIEEGLSSWETTLGEIFDDWKLDPGFASVTVEQLMQHRGGLERGDAIMTWDFDVDASMAARDQRSRIFRERLALPPAFPAGATFSYSNLGYGLLGHIAERVGGAPFEELMKGRLFSRLHMESADFGWPCARGADGVKGHLGHADEPQVIEPETNPLSPVIRGAGDMSMTVGDFLRFARAHLEALGGVDAGLSPATVERLHSPPTSIVASPGYAAGWAVKQLPGGGTEHDHHGSAGGFYAYVSLRPEAERALVLFSNAMLPLTEDWTRKLCLVVHARLDAIAESGPRVATLTTEVGDDLVADSHGVIYSSNYGGAGICRLTLAGERETLMPEYAKLGAIALDEARGRLYTTDYDRGVLYQFDLDSREVSVLGEGLEGPAGLVVGKDGELYVSANARHRIYRFDLDGSKSVVAEGEPLNWPTGLAMDSGGALVAANMFRGELVRIATGRSEVIASLPVQPGTYNLGYLEFVGPDLFVAHCAENRIYVVTPDGSASVFAGTGAPGAIDGVVSECSFRNPVGLCAVPGRHALYVTQDEHNLLRRIELD